MEKITFQQENDKKKKLPGDEIWEISIWPFQSLDFSPIESVWDELDRWVRREYLNSESEHYHCLGRFAINCFLNINFVSYFFVSK